MSQGRLEQREKGFARITELLSNFETQLKADFTGYRNHCCRVFAYVLELLPELTPETLQKLAITTAFHDVGLWTANTVDYLPPSIELAQAYLNTVDLSEWSDEIGATIHFHHKVTPYRGPFPLVEAFRKADLADFSLGLFPSGISKNVTREMGGRFPNSGFHKTLLVKTLHWVCRHPLNPAPILKW